MRLALIVALLLTSAPGISYAAEARGDANADDAVNVADVLFLVNFLFGNGTAPLRTCLADVNANQSVSITDVFYLVNFLFAAGPMPPPQPPETCNNADDDCDGTPDDGASASCGAWPNTNTSVCATGTCTYSCNAGFADCDNDLTTGCEISLNNNPLCTAGPTNLGSISGDVGMDVVSRNGVGEEWFVLRITENLLPDRDLTARIDLTVPAGVNYDLFVYCFSCAGTAFTSNSGGAGVPELVFVRRNDITSTDVSDDLIIEVRYSGGSSCSPWTLTATGNVITNVASLCSP